MLLAAVLPALALAAAQPTISRAQLGPIPRDCSSILDKPSDDLSLREAEGFADCLVANQETSPADVERGVGLYRRILALSGADTRVPPMRGDLRYKIVRAYGINGEVPAMLREAGALRGFLAGSPSLRCDFFDRLAVEFDDWKQSDASRAMVDRFDLATCPRYVPRKGWHDAWQPAMNERWFGNQLLAMGEKSFGEPGAMAGFTRRFRLTTLPTFTPGFTARIDTLANGRTRLHWVILDGAGGYEPGKVARSGDRYLDAGEELLVDRALRKADIADLPVEEPRQLERVDPKTGQKSIAICVDGTYWVFELLTERGRSFASRLFCGYRDDKLRNLIQTIDALLPPDVPRSVRR